MRQRLKEKFGETSSYTGIHYTNKRDRTLIEGNLQLRKSLRDMGRNNKL
jgi:hypothetical protein